MLTHTLRRYVFALFCLALSGSIADAQVIQGGIRGIVKDETGGVLVGVTVETSSPARIGEPAVTVTNNMGLYRFENLPVGVYTVSFSLPGFTTINRENVRVEVGRTTQLDMTLPLGGAEETVTVTAASPVIDTVHADYSTNFSQELVKNVPTTRNSYFDLVTAVPGVKSDHVTNISTFSIYGSDTNQNSFQMDGVDVSSVGSGGPWDYPNYDIIQEVEVLGVGASAEFANFQGGAINVVTKSGSNDFSGAARVFAFDDWMVGNNTPDEEFPMKQDYWLDTSLQLGGPIISDKLWMIGLLSYAQYRGVPVGVELIPEVKSGWEVRTFFKLTSQLSGQDNIEFSYDNNMFDVPNEPWRTRPVEATDHEHGHAPVISARWSHMFGANTLLEVKGGGIYVWDREDSLSDDFDTPGRYDWGTGFYADNTMGAWRSRQNKNQVNASLTHYADDFIKGSHDFKFGVQFLRSIGTSYWTYFGPNYAFYYDYYGYPYYALFKDPSSYGATVDNTAFFVNDNWTLTDRVSLNVGLRFDHGVGGIAEGDQYDRRLEEKTGVSFPGVPGIIKFDTWSPRVGISVQLDESAKTVAKTSYGRFYGKMAGNWMARLSEGNLTTEAFLYNEDTGQYDIPFWTWDPKENLGIDPNLRNQYTDQFYVGVEREIVPDLGLDVSFVYKKEGDWVRAKDVGGTYVSMPFVDEWRGQTQTLTAYNRVSPSSESLYQLTNRDDFRQSYKSLVIQANKRWSVGWTMNGSYQWQRGEGYASGAIGTGGQSFSSFGPRMFGADPNDLINAYGRMGTDNTQTVKVSSAFDLPYGIVTGVRYTFESGRPYGRLINVTGLGQGVREVLAEPRGSYQLDAVHDLLLRFNKDFRFGGQKLFQLSVDIFNVFNRASASRVRNNSTQAGEDFGQKTQVPGPRRAMFGVRFEF